MAQRRALRLGDLIKEEVSKIILYELKDPRVGFVTITRVKVSDDLKKASVYWTIWGDEKAKEDFSECLRRAKGFIKKELGKRVRVKFLPEIEFLFDDSLQYEQRIEELLREIRGREGEGDV